MALPIPIPGIKDIIDGITAIRRWFDQRNRQFLFGAWNSARLGDVYKLVTDYYASVDQHLFSYPQARGCSKLKMPLYVIPEWEEISSTTLRMSFRNETKTFFPSKTQEAFWDFYSELRQFLPYDLDIFRLVDLQVIDGNLHLTFELGKFSHSVMCQYILEHEVVTLLARDSGKQPDKLSLRNDVAANPQMISTFLQYNVARIGICSLILLRATRETYIPVVQKRSPVSMIQHRLFDPVSSCIFEVATTPKADFELQHTVLREVYEELFGNPDVTEKSHHLDPYFFYHEDGISDLVELLQAGSATFEITGFCIDLIRFVPEITTMLIVNDETYFQKHYRPRKTGVAAFKLNPEFDLGSLFQIPSNLKDLDTYLKESVVSDPDSDPNFRGFDPMKWTLPGGFSFYQGLRRAVSSSLL